MRNNQICCALTRLLILLICLVLAPCAWAEETASEEIAESQISFRIPQNVTSIESEAFYNCTEMTSVFIPASVRSIGDGAFHGCINLTDVYLEGAWKDISVGSDNAPLINATIHSAASGSWGDLQWRLDEDSGKLVIYGSGAMDNFSQDSNYSGALPAWRPYAESINTVEILDGVTAIGEYAFYGCTNLSSVTIPSSVTSIGGRSFGRCEGLNVVSIPSGVTTIGVYAFSFCENLNSVSIPTSMQTIESLAFYSCSSLADVYYGGTEEQWQNISIARYSSDGYNAELYDATKHFNTSRREGSWGDLLWSLDEVGTLVISGSGEMGDSPWEDEAWRPYKEDIETVEICEGVTSIGSGNFSECTSLRSVTIPSSMTAFGSDAFSSCTSLSSITIPSGVTSIGSFAFNGCANLLSVTIPSSMTSISEGTFFNCTSLRSVIIPSSVTNIWDDAFAGCTSLRVVTIPSSVTSIDDGVFYGCTSLSSVTIPSSVTSIGESTFAFCSSLLSVIIPSSVTEIGDNAFHNCTSLSSVTIPSSVTEIRKGTFSFCKNLRSVTISPGVKSIGTEAFAVCMSLQSVIIPSSVTSFAGRAFFPCPSLSDVYYSGTEAQWQAIDSGNYNASLYSSTIHYNSDQVPVPVITSTVCDPDDCIVTGRFSYNSIPNEFTITVTAQGEGLSYSWLWREEGETQSQWKDISQLSLMQVVSGQTSNAITIRTEDLNLNGHNYEFMCLVNNSYASAVSSIITIHVVDSLNPNPVTKPAIRWHPQNVTAAGSSASFSVTATGSDLSYQWLVRTSSNASWENAADEGSRTATLTVSVTNEKNGYEYRCKVFNSAGTVYSRGATLKVNGPEITSVTCDADKVSARTAGSGAIPNQFTITVTAQGDGLSYSWKWREKGQETWNDISTIESVPMYNPLVNFNNYDSNELTLYLNDLNVNGHTYEFMCVVSNGILTSESDPVTIEVVDLY